MSDDPSDAGLGHLETPSVVRTTTPKTPRGTPSAQHEMLLRHLLRSSRMKLFFLIFWLLLNASGKTECDPGRRNKNTRPSPSLEMPIVELMEPHGEVYDPRPDDIDPNLLRDRLGSSFDYRVMRVEEPKGGANSNGTIAVELRKTRIGHLVPDGPIPKYIRRVQLRYVRLGDGKRIDVGLGKKVKKMFRDLIWLQSYCPVVSKWKDLGSRFWPRWFLENSCAQRVTCSYPKGMTCRPHRSKGKTLLRWHCQVWETRSGCDWLKVQYPLVTECRCAC